MNIFPILFGVLLVIVLGGVAGFFISALLTPLPAIFACITVSAVLALLGVTSIARGNRSGDGGMGDVMVGVIAIVLAVGVLAGAGAFFYWR